MIKKIAWDTFKKTGDINAFLELKQIENIQKQFNIEEPINIDIKGDSKENGEYQNKWNNNIRK